MEKSKKKLKRCSAVTDDGGGGVGGWGVAGHSGFESVCGGEPSEAGCVSTEHSRST